MYIRGKLIPLKITSFLYHRGYIPSQREEGWEIRSKETRGVGSEIWCKLKIIMIIDKLNIVLDVYTWPYVHSSTIGCVRCSHWICCAMKSSFGLCNKSHIYILRRFCHRRLTGVGQTAFSLRNVLGCWTDLPVCPVLWSCQSTYWNGWLHSFTWIKEYSFKRPYKGLKLCL